MGRGSGGGVKSITVGVQFQRHPSRRSKGGVNPNQSADNKQKRILISTPALHYVHYVKLFMGYPQVCKQLCA